MKKPTWKPIRVRLGQIKAWEHNPRLSTKAQAKRLIVSENEFGQSQAFNLNPLEDGLYPLLDGHQRLSAWLTIYGDDYEMDGRVCSRTLDEDERKKYVIVHHVGATGSWDWNALSGWDDDNLESWGIDQKAVDGWNNDANNAKEMLAAKEEHADAEPEIDRAEELQEKWKVRTGDLWQIGQHKLICGDCTDAAVVERLMAGEKADMVFTDPPYGIKRDGGFGGFGGFGTPIARRQYDDDWDGERPTKEQFEFILSYSAKVIIWGGNFFADILPRATHWAVWDKNNTMPTFGDCELAWTSLDRKSVKKFEVTYNGLIGKEKDRFHPTQKPVELYDKCLAEYAKDVVTILDFYLGSGTTLVACENLNRKGRGVEISEKYCAVTLERMATAFPELVIEKI